MHKVYQESVYSFFRLNFREIEDAIETVLTFLPTTNL